MSQDRLYRSTRGLVVALAVAMLIDVSICAGLLLWNGEPLQEASEGSGLLLSGRILGRIGIDSWRTMSAAYEKNKESPGNMYWVFLEKGVKFQYPPSSLLVIPLLPQLPIDEAYRAKVATPSYLALFFTILCTALIAMRLLSPSRSPWIAWRDPLTWCVAALVGCLGWTYYPLAKGHNLGQIQVFLGALVALALLLNVFGLRGLSGACIGLCCLVKPQYGLLFLWAVLRRDKHFALGCLLAVTAGLAASLYTFGLQNHLQYLEVLQRLGRFGEAYGPNQTVNGFLQRWLENGSAIKFQSRKLPPYHSVVYYGTLISSALIVGLALFMPTAKSQRGGPIDMAVALIAATMASPIAWEHHYGAFFPIFAIALSLPFATARAGLALLLSYELVANEILRPQLVFANRWTGLLGSHLFYGAVLLFAFMLVGRMREPVPTQPAPP